MRGKTAGRFAAGRRSLPLLPETGFDSALDDDRTGPVPGEVHRRQRDIGTGFRGGINGDLAIVDVRRNDLQVVNRLTTSFVTDANDPMDPCPPGFPGAR